MKTFLKIFFTILILHFAFCISVFSQNLVPNPSFEEYSNCPNDDFMLPNDWYTCSLTPDYCNACDTTNGCGVPANGFGYQEAADGKGYCGFYGLSVHSNWSYKEYLGSELLEPLITGEKYYVSFKINFSGSPAIDMAINNIGLLFSTVSYQDFQPYDDIWSIPTLNFAHVYDTNIISDDISWTTIKGSIIADSNYQYILIGNFFDVAHTDTILVNNNYFQHKSYYFLDDVCVSMDSSICDMNSGFIENDNIQNSVSVYPSPFSDFIKIESYLYKNYTIKIYNILGELVIENDIKDKQKTISTKNLLPGIYFISIYINNLLIINQKTIKI